MGARMIVPRLIGLAAMLTVVWVFGVQNAVAAPPTLQSVGVVPLRHLAATFTLPPGGELRSIEIATSPAVASDGAFLIENVVFEDFLPVNTSPYVSSSQAPPGFFYVHISSYDTNCFTCPLYEWSSILTVTIPPDPAPPPPPPAVTFVDKKAPFQTFSTSSTQRVRTLAIRLLLNENATLTVKGSIAVAGASKVYRYKSVTLAAVANVPVRVRPKLARLGLKAIKRALKRRKKLRAKFSITAVDQSGNTSVSRRTIKLKR